MSDAFISLETFRRAKDAAEAFHHSFDVFVVTPFLAQQAEEHMRETIVLDKHEKQMPLTVFGKAVVVDPERKFLGGAECKTAVWYQVEDELQLYYFTP